MFTWRAILSGGTSTGVTQTYKRVNSTNGLGTKRRVKNMASTTLKEGGLTPFQKTHATFTMGTPVGIKYSELLTTTEFENSIYSDMIWRTRLDNHVIILVSTPSHFTITRGPARMENSRD